MAETLLCDNCGAPIAPEDAFCGECGAPRPIVTPGSAPAGPEITHPFGEASVEPAPHPTSASIPRGPSEARRTAAKVIAILSAVVSVVLCGLGLIVALITPVQDATRQDMLIGSTVMCFCPGVLALAMALVLGLVVVKRK